MTIDLRTPLSWRSAFRFPIQNRLARRETAWGGLLLIILPVLGWILNLGHRIHMVHRMQQGLPAWPGWHDYRQLLKHGSVATAGIVVYHLPAMLAALAAWRLRQVWIGGLAVFLWLLATFTLPGFMTFYCVRFDPREVFNPFRALRRAFQGGRAYLHAWGIGIVAVVLSFTGLLALGVGFAFTSVWFWQVVGYSFASVFSAQYSLIYLHDLPPDLPRPTDDGGAAHLPGRAVPGVPLPSTSGGTVDLSHAGPGRVVVYIYPMTGRPGVPLPDGWDLIPGARGCTPQTCGFRDAYQDLRTLGVDVMGLSTQDTGHQREMVARLRVPFPILSDAALRFADALQLPRFSVDGRVLLKRLTLVVRAGKIEHVFYPVFPPDESAAVVQKWLRAQGRAGGLPTA